MEIPEDSNEAKEYWMALAETADTKQELMLAYMTLLWTHLEGLSDMRR